MTEKLNPVRCGCGGEAFERSYVNTIHVTEDGYDHTIYCSKCNIETKMYDTESEAVEAWNRAMGNRMELQTVERTAKVTNLVLTSNPPQHVLLCGNCGGSIDKTNWKYCPNCGARLEWE